MNRYFQFRSLLVGLFLIAAIMGLSLAATGGVAAQQVVELDFVDSARLDSRG